MEDDEFAKISYSTSYITGKKPRITGLLGLLGIWWDYCLVAMGGLEPPTPAL